MKVCSKCGFSTEDDSAFCPKCGSPLAEAPQPAPELPAKLPEGTGRYQNAPGFSSEPVPQAPGRNDAQLWMILNIVAVLLCCPILGVIGIVFGAIGMSSYNRGDYSDAISKASTSKVLFIVSVILGALTWVGILLAFFTRGLLLY